ncbi:MAG: 50S ribosomal protein L4 [Caldilineaceae bacterium]
MMLVALKNMAGQEVGQVELNDSIFAAPINGPLMHQALVRQLSNRRLGTHSTKTRGEVAGGGRKPWRQKGTGRARQGSTRAPNWVGGGIVFGPSPRKYIKAMPRKMNRAAIRSALSSKAGSGQIVVLDSIRVETPRTKSVVSMLKALGVSGSVLMVLPGEPENLKLSAGNLPNVTLVQSHFLNVRDVLGHDVVLLPNDSLPSIEDWLAVHVAQDDADAGADAGTETGADSGAEE